MIPHSTFSRPPATRPPRRRGQQQDAPIGPPWAEWPIADNPLAAKFLEALDRLEPREVGWICRACRTTPTNLVNVGGVVVQSIETFRDGTYEPSEDGMVAFVACAFVGPAPGPRNRTANALNGGEVEVADLVAWNPSKPDEWWCREGGATFLGASAFETAHFCHRRPVSIFRNPASWIRAGGDLVGIVVLDWTLAAFELRELKGLVAEDAAHGREIEHHMRQPVRPSPPVLVEVAA
jgi:hypothetical protein